MTSALESPAPTNEAFIFPHKPLRSAAPKLGFLFVLPVVILVVLVFMGYCLIFRRINREEANYAARTSANESYDGLGT